MAELITNTLQQPGEFDALRMLARDEPFFPLLGRDRLAPPLVQKWADDNRARAFEEHKAGKISDDRLERELRKSTEAEAIGWAMTAFKAGDMAKKVKEQPTVKSYSGHELPEETKLRDALQSARIHARSGLQQAIGDLMELEAAAVTVQQHEAAAANVDGEALAQLLRVVRDLMQPLQVAAELAAQRTF